MTLEQYQAALKIIKEFLLCRGHDADNIAHRDNDSVIENGDWMLVWIKKHYSPTCPNCYQPYIEGLLKRLQNGSYLIGTPIANDVSHPWTPACSDKVRKTAGLADSH